MLKLSQRTKSLMVYLVLIYTPALLLLLAVAFVSKKTGIPIYNFMVDPFTIVNRHPTFGIVSYFGVLVLGTAATICYFCRRILLRYGNNPKSAVFLLLAGIFTTTLMLDDLFLGHETLAKFIRSEKIIFFLYGCWLLVILLGFRNLIMESDYLILLIALAFFGLSISIDIFEESVEQYVGQWRVFFEDGFKTLGFVGWFGYFARYCYFQIINILSHTEN